MRGRGDRSILRFKGLACILAAVCWTLAFCEAVRAQNIYDELRTTFLPIPEPLPRMTELQLEAYTKAYTEQFGAPPPEVPQIYANYLARAAIFGDNTRLDDFAGGNFLPSAIPAPGQPYFGTGPRANLQAAGTALRISGRVPTPATSNLIGDTQLLVENAGFASDGGSDVNVTIRQAYAQYNWLSLGLLETAFADPGAVPETLDIAGPNGRVTVQDAGLGDTPGRISIEPISNARGGLGITLSAEQPVPEIETIEGLTRSFARFPDFVTAVQYAEGEFVEKEGFRELWHTQFAALFRDLSLEDASDTIRESAFGWGLSLSGAYRFGLNPRVRDFDCIVFSTTYGEGISRYIVDLNNAPDTLDAARAPSGSLTPLPVFAWYAGYKHNWTNRWRSTLVYGRVEVDNDPLLEPIDSAYHAGEYVSVNLLHHREVEVTILEEEDKTRRFYTGVEYLYGLREDLDATDEEAHRLMWVTAISK